MSEPLIAAARLPLMIVAALVSMAVLARAGRSLRGTTLIAPRNWALFAIALIAGVEILAAAIDASAPLRWLPAARYVASVASFCPLMAVLGAKRPQDRAWQLIVLALWSVVSLPAIQDVLYHYGRPVALDPAWRWFLVILVGVELANYLPTRFWPSTLLCVSAQLLLLGEQLPWARAPETSSRAPAALLLMATACGLVACGVPRRRSTADASTGLWTDFRDAYGLLWAVRVQQRAANSGPTDVSHAPPLVQTASKVTPEQPAGDATPSVAGAETFAALLLRFVSKKWIADHLATVSNPFHLKS